MGIFSKHKEKAVRPDLLNTQPDNPTPGRTPQSSRPNVSFNDSTYYTNSNASSEEAKITQAPPQNQNARPGTTVTTTTTTTTTTTIVSADGTTHTYSHPYNPSTDPPPQASETIVNQTQPGSSHSPAPFTGPVANVNNNNSTPQNQPTHHRNDSAVDVQQSNHLQPAAALGRKVTQQQQYMTPTPLHRDPSTDREILPIPGTEHTSVGPFVPPRSEQRTSPGQVSNSPSPNFDENQHLQGTKYPTAHHTEAVNELPADEIVLPTPVMPVRSERRRSRDGIIAPLNTQSIDSNSASRRSDEIVSPSSPVRSRTPNFSRPSAGSSPTIQAPVPTHPTVVHPPSQTAPTPAHTADIVDPSSEAPPLRTKTSGGKGQRQSLRSAFKGIRGAGDALRGAVNEGIAHTMHDRAEEERMKALRQKGLNDWRGSGLNEHVPAGMRDSFRGRKEKRSSFGNETGIHGSEGPNGLHPLDEVESLRDEQSLRNERIN